MNRLSIFAAPWLRSIALTALPARSTKAVPSAISSGAVKALCLTFFVILAAAAGRGQSTSATDGWVVLPVGEYTALRHAAFPLDAEPAPPPIEATLSRI